MQPLAILGPVDAILEPVIGFVILALALLNMVTRMLAHRSNVKEAEQGDEELSRSPIHAFTNIALVLASFYYLTVHYHGGVILASMAVGLFLTDFFEFAARELEAREDRSLEKPKAALGASLLLLTYAAYQTLFYLVAPIWDKIIV